ncbi:MAG: methionine--tRNA ligase [Microgenomates group bacterium]
MKRKVFISTAIPYVNGDPHIGHSLEYVQTDVMARFFRIVLGKENVFALTGSDENALKNVLAAEAANKETIEFVDEKTAEFRKLSKTLNLSFDDFIRTTQERHIRGAQKLWASFKPSDIYQDTYEGMYCVGCEEFKTEKDLVDGLCPEHRKKPELVSEKNYFFKLTNYQDQIEKLITEDTIKIVPEKRKNEVLGFVREGLKDFSISRSRERARNWGVPVPNDESQVMYVWVDALSNYITALDYADEGEKYQNFWNNADTERIHVIGKGIVKFHALYWVGMLLSANVPLPTQEFVHGYVTVEGNKIGKSLGNAIHPDEVVKKYGIDAFRYYLLREIPAYGDGDFSWNRMDEVYKSDLQNGLGNLVARVAAMADGMKFEPILSPSMSKVTTVYLDEYQFDRALGTVWTAIKNANIFVSEKRVWELKDKEREDALTKLVGEIRQIMIDLAPFMPETAEEISKQFNGKKIVKGNSLFPRLA